MKRHAAGFTLVELLVALFITSVVFALGYGAINQALANRATLERNQDRLVAVQNAVRMLVTDFTQLSPRPVRQTIGDGSLPALSADGRTPGLATLTHAGWTNPAGAQRSSLQRVRYILDGQTLKREYWLVLDATEDPRPRSRVLLQDVRSVQLRFMDSNHAWQSQWPAVSSAGDPVRRSLYSRPLAVEVTLELTDWGRIVRIIEVPG